MKYDASLTLTELLSLDVLITVAQQRGRSLADRVSNAEEYAESFAEVHGGLELSPGDREIIGRMRELAQNLSFAPTLGQLIELRGQALKGQI